MRAAIFIDGAYLIKRLNEAKVTPDYTKLCDYLLAPLRRQAPLDLLRCYFYYCAPWVSEKPTEDELRRLASHERFVAELQKLDRWQVRLGKLERRFEGEREVFAQKRVDVQLSVDVVRHCAAGHVQHVVLVAGDSDFIPAVVAAKESGATLTLWCESERTVHRDLMVHSDEVHRFNWKTFPSRKSTKPAPKESEKVAAEKAAAEKNVAEKSEKAVRESRAESSADRGAVKGASQRAESRAASAAKARDASQGEAAPSSPDFSAGSLAAPSKESTKAPVKSSRGRSGRSRAASAAKAKGESTSATKAAPAPSKPSAPASVAVEPAPVVDGIEEEGDDIGNRKLPESGDDKKSGRRRRRGGRGRHRPAATKA